MFGEYSYFNYLLSQMILDSLKKLFKTLCWRTKFIWKWHLKNKCCSSLTSNNSTMKMRFQVFIQYVKKKTTKKQTKPTKTNARFQALIIIFKVLGSIYQHYKKPRFLKIMKLKKNSLPKINRKKCFL